MSDIASYRPGAAGPWPVYVIHIEGQLDPLWADWFEGFCLTNLPEQNQVVLRGAVADQSALHGLFNRIRDLNLTIITVERVQN
jgi:hypothetical protein